VAAVLCLLAVAELGWMHGAGRRSAGPYCRDDVAGLMTPSQIEGAYGFANGGPLAWEVAAVNYLPTTALWLLFDYFAEKRRLQKTHTGES
jgi:hypothetical protein